MMEHDGQPDSEKRRQGKMRRDDKQENSREENGREGRRKGKYVRRQGGEKRGKV